VSPVMVPSFRGLEPWRSETRSPRAGSPTDAGRFHFGAVLGIAGRDSSASEGRKMFYSWPVCSGVGRAFSESRCKTHRVECASALPETPLSDKSDFGWRDREGEAACSVRAASPSPPSPASGGGGQNDACVAYLAPAPENLITFPHFSVSSASTLAKSAG